MSSNRIWAFCSEHGLKYRRGASGAKCLDLRRQLEEKEWTGIQRFCIDEYLRDHEQAWERRVRYKKAIEEIVATTPDMLRLMQLRGLGAIGAFALVAYTENVHRFETPKKLVAYFGINPTVCSSGKSDGVHATSKRGNGTVRSILAECAQTALRGKNGNIVSWAKRLLAQKKPFAKVVMAVARKLVMYAWHILMGHPTPDRENETMFRHKLIVLATGLGKEKIRAMGYESRDAFSAAVCDPLYAHLPATATAE